MRDLAWPITAYRWDDGGVDPRDLEDVLAALGSARSVIALLECSPTPDREHHLGQLAAMVRDCQAELSRREQLIEEVLATCR